MINPTDKHVGSRLRMRRLMLDMSQADLAKTIGVTFQQVQKYEKGEDRVSASRLQQASRVLGVPIEFFFDGLRQESDGQVAVPSYVKDFLACTEGVALVKAFTRITKSCGAQSSRLLRGSGLGWGRGTARPDGTPARGDCQIKGRRRHKGHRLRSRRRRGGSSRLRACGRSTCGLRPIFVLGLTPA